MYSQGIEDREKGRKTGDVVKEETAERVTWKGIFGARDHCDADITTARRLPISLRGAPVLS